MTLTFRVGLPEDQRKFLIGHTPVTGSPRIRRPTTGKTNIELSKQVLTCQWLTPYCLYFKTVTCPIIPTSS
jgi:hypothetical protein